MWTSVADCCIKIVHQITRRKSVLYVCERVNTNTGSAMAAAHERYSSKCMAAKSGQPDRTSGFPIPITFPDGETSNHQYNPCLKHNGGPEQEAEMVRGYLKPPENKNLSDMEIINPNRSSSMGILGDEWESGRAAMSSSGSSHPQKSYSNTSSPHPQHRYSTPLEAQNACHPHYSTRGTGVTGSSSFSLSSSSSSMSSGPAMGGSPRGRKAFQMQQLLQPFLCTREKVIQDRGPRRQSRTRGMRGTGAPHAGLRNSSVPSTLENIAVLPCGVAEPQQSLFPSDQDHDDPFYVHLSPEVDTHNVEDDPPSIYSEVIENPSLFANVSGHERRTSSGKI